MVNFDEFDYEGDMTIDPDNLHMELVRQSSLMIKYARASAYADKLARRAERKYKTVRSKLIKGAWEGGEDLIGVRMNQQNVEAYYRAHRDYIRSRKEWEEAQYRADLVRSAMFNLKDNLHRVELLVRLYTAEYYTSSARMSALSGDSYEQYLKERAKSTRDKVMRAKETNTATTRKRRKLNG